MKDFVALIGALLVNLVLLLGVMYLPPAGVRSLENIYVLVWVAFGLLINLGFLRRLLKSGDRRPLRPPSSPQEVLPEQAALRRRSRAPLA